MTHTPRRQKAVDDYVRAGLFSENPSEYARIITPLLKRAVHPDLNLASKEDVMALRSEIHKQLMVRRHLARMFGIRHKAIWSLVWDLEDFTRMLRPKPEFRLNQAIESRRRRLAKRVQSLLESCSETERR